MSAIAYYTIKCDGDDGGCQEESTFEPTASQARASATREGWHFRRLGGERWFCPDHIDEWKATKEADPR